MSRLELVEAALRRGQQAILVSRLRRRHLIPVAELLDRCGFAALDVFGGVTFEACIRFLGEDPFDRLRAIRAAAPNTPLLGVISGQALVGHHHVADDVVDAFIAEAATAGLSIFRCFDPLNDTRNLERCLAAVHRAGAAAEASIVYTESPVHGVAGFIAIGERLAGLGYDALNIHDPTGLLGAGSAAELVRGLAAATKVPIGVHSASLSGQSGLAYLAAIQAGASRLDVALTPLAGGASLPATEGVVSALRGTGHTIDIDIDALGKASKLLDDELVHYRDIIDGQAGRLDPSVLRTQLRPQTVAHMLAELRERDMVGHRAETEAEVARVRAELGFPPLISPLAEIVATQAVYNVCDGDRYATISHEVKDYCLGLYGASPGTIDADVLRAVNGRDEAITCRPADLLEPQMAGARTAMEREGLDPSSDAAVATYIMFGAEYAALLRGEAVVELLGDEPESEAAPVAEAAQPLVAAGTADSAVTATTASVVFPGPPDDVRELTVEVDGESYRVRVTAAAGTLGSGGGGSAVALAAATPGKPVITEGTVVAPMQGLILKVQVAVGQRVQLGEVVAVLEAMKMQNDITAPRAGTISDVFVAAGSVVSPKDAICQIG